MSSDQIVIDVKNLSKRYEIYATPRDRLKQLLIPSFYRMCARVVRLFGRTFDYPPPQYFREFWALHNVSFQVKKGETLGVVGRNGSGKSTLLQIICSTLSPTNGDVHAKGRISALLELGSGFNPEYTGRENVFLNGQILGISQEEMKFRYQAIVEFADIGDFIDQPVKTYSSGMSLRLAFAVAINVDPEILVIDEALAVGDVGFQAKCFAKIDELKKRGVTLLFVSHSAAAVTQLCNRAILLDRGELLFLGMPYQTILAYNQLANTGTTNMKNVREEVVALAEQANNAVVDSPSVDWHEVKSERSAQHSSTALDAYFDTQLVNAIKPLRHNPHGGEIVSVSLFDLAGKEVNSLPLHQQFVVRFSVRFDVGFKNVRFAWVLRNVKGLILGGGASHRPGVGISFSEGTSLVVESRFVNIFNEGTYIVDINLRGKIDQDNEFIHRISNALVIRSFSCVGAFRNGVVDCLVEPAFQIMNDDGSRYSDRCK